MTDREFGKQLKALRKANGFRQQDIAEALHVTDAAVSKWERGYHLPQEHAYALHKLIGLPIEMIAEYYGIDKIIMEILQKKYDDPEHENIADPLSEKEKGKEDEEMKKTVEIINSIRHMFKDSKDEWMSGAEVQKYHKRESFPEGKPTDRINGKRDKRNILLSKNIAVKPDRKASNANILAVGMKDKNRLIAQNLNQGYGSYVIYDPDGEIMSETGKAMEQNGYQVYVLDVRKNADSDYYDPLRYAKTEEDIMDIAECISSQEELFFKKVEFSLLMTIFSSLIWYRPEECRKLENALELLGKDEDELSGIMDHIKAIHSESRTYVYYEAYMQAAQNIRNMIKSAAKNTLKGMIIKYNAKRKQIDPDDLCGKKAVLYIVYDKDCSGNPLCSIISNQIYRKKYDDVSEIYRKEWVNKEIPILQFVCPDIAAIFRIPEFTEKLICSRKMKILHIMFTDSIHEMESLLQDDHETVESCFDIKIYNGNITKDTKEYISKPLGNSNNKKTNRISDSEDLLTLKKDHVIILIKGYKPIIDQAI